MGDDKKLTPTAQVARIRARMPLYVKLGWLALVVFALVGNVAGHREGSILVAMLVSLMWVMTRIVFEGINAANVLLLAQEHDAHGKKSKPRDDDDKGAPPPPLAPV